MHYVIIGNGGAGVSALKNIREIDHESKITILSREKYPPYSPCSLPNLISGEIEKTVIFRFDDQFYKRHKAKFLKNSEVLNINSYSKEIILKNGKKIKYDKLLIAAGATPIIPKKIKGLHLKGIHIMGTLDSTIEILNHINQGVQHAVVVGGGFMGVETAVNLRKRGITVSVVEMLSNILSRMLDPDISEKVEQILIEHGINLILNDTLKEINGQFLVNSITLEKKKINCDMIVIAIGVAPNIGIIQNSGIKVNNGVIVDSTMQTNIKDIYAAGDITEVWEQISGKKGSFAIWPNAIEQGRIAGLNMAGCPTIYNGAEVINVLNVFNTPVVAIGSTLKDIGKCEVLSRFTPCTSKKILLENNRIIGLQFVGTIRNSGVFYSFMKNNTDVIDIKYRLLDDNFINIVQ